MSTKYEKVAKRVIDLSGGKDKLNEEMDRKLNSINEKWNQDVDAIGKILRAHLFIEHYVTECLSHLNPNLSNLKDARLSFSQKILLLEGYSEETKELATGIKRLNIIRNRLADSLKACVTDQDKESLLSVKSFRSLREELAKPGRPSEENIIVLEDFAKHVGSRLESLSDPNSLAKRFEQAISEITNET
ncbi:MAG: hypothetical protein LUQ26_04570 [Methylococcaceae bacterium]|nr:hypothetical protein [Methylococcaceae bacterium]